MRRFTPLYVGSKRIAGLPLPEQRVFVINDGSMRGTLREAMHKSAGWSPALTHWCAAQRPALIHAHFGTNGVLAMPLARRLALPLVVTFHGFEVTTHDQAARRRHFTHRKYLRGRAELFRRGAQFLAISQFLRDRLLEQGAPPERTDVHYIGVDWRRFTADPKVPREPIVLFVGRLIENKGCHHLIEAMRRIRAEHEHVRLVIIGDGPERVALERQAHASLRHVEFLGRQSHADVKAWLNRARVLCVPSVTAASGASEGLGMVFLEAQAMNVPVVSFTTGGIPEAVRHEQTGLLADEGDVDQLARHLHALLSDPAMWRRMSEQGPLHVRERFDLERQSARLEQRYADLLEHPQPATRPARA